MAEHHTTHESTGPGEAEQISHAPHKPGVEHVGEHGEHHAVPLPVYYKVFGGLMILLVATLGAAAVNLGPMNLPIAMAIAVGKAYIIVTYFMHLKWSTWLVRFFAGAAFFWLLIMFAITMSDYASRDWITVPKL